MNVPLPVDTVKLVQVAKATGVTFGTAESLTAGMLASTIASVPGASAVLRGGLIVYATDLKESLAQVSQSTLSHHGVVSAECARELAVGARRVCNAEWGIGLTGVAGPERQDNQQVGTVFISLATPHDAVVRQLRLTPTSNDPRSSIRLQSVQYALTMMWERLDRVWSTRLRREL